MGGLGWLGPARSESSSPAESSQFRNAIDDDNMNVAETGVISRT